MRLFVLICLPKIVLKLNKENVTVDYRSADCVHPADGQQVRGVIWL